MKNKDLSEVLRNFAAQKGRAKVRYFRDYLLWPTVACVAALIMLGSLVYDMVTHRDPLLNVIMVNPISETAADEAAFGVFFAEYGYEAPAGSVSNAKFLVEEGSLHYHDSYTAMLVMLASPQDVFMGNGTAYLRTVEQGLLLDLSTVMPEVLQDIPEDRILYSDAAGAKESYPCAIALGENPWLEAHGYYRENCYFAIPERSENREIAKNFLLFLLEKQA